MENTTWLSNARFPVGVRSNARFPVGVRFKPDDEDLILCYLFNKVYNNPLPCPIAVVDCDIYGGDGRAWKRMLEESEEESLYFFTTLKKKTEKSSSKRAARVTSYGTWKGEVDKKIILEADCKRNYHIGSKRNFSLKPKEGRDHESGETGNWVMYEYRLDGCLHYPEKDDVLQVSSSSQTDLYCVICRIKKSNRKSKECFGH